MEQQNQQPIQEKTETKPPIKTNWKFVAIVVVLGLVVGGGIVWYANLPTRTSNIIVSNETPVNNYNYEESRPMYQCIKDNDCMLVKDGYCGKVMSINKAYQTAWTEQDKINSEQARKNRQTCKVADRESLDINNYTSSCYNSGCNVKASQPTQTDETADWQAYRNDEFGFEVRYPEEWTTLEHSSQSVEFHHPDNNPYISLVVFENIGGSGDQSVRGVTFCEAYPDQCTSQKFSIDGVQTAIEWRLHDASVNFGIPNKNYVMSISFNSNFEKTSLEEVKLFLQILSTFRFVP